MMRLHFAYIFHNNTRNNDIQKEIHSLIDHSIMILSILPLKTLSIKTFSMMVKKRNNIQNKKLDRTTIVIMTFSILLLSASTHKHNKHNGLNCGTLHNIIFNVNLSVIILLIKRLFKQTYLAS
jgi:hypothetical protein